MRLAVRKSGEVMIGFSELEAVTLVSVIAVTKEASDEQPKFFNRTQKAVLRDLHKNLQNLDKAIEKAEAVASDSSDNAETPTESTDTEVLEG